MDHKRLRQQRKRRNTDGRLYSCLLEIGHTLSDFERLVRSRVNTADHLAFTGSNPLPTGLEPTDSRATRLTHDCGAFSGTVLNRRGKTGNGGDGPASKAIASKEGSKSTWRATRRGGDGSVTLPYVSIRGPSIQSWDGILQRFHVRHGFLSPK